MDAHVPLAFSVVYTYGILNSHWIGKTLVICDEIERSASGSGDCNSSEAKLVEDVSQAYYSKSLDPFLIGPRFRFHLCLYHGTDTIFPAFQLLSYQ